MNSISAQIEALAQEHPIDHITFINPSFGESELVTRIDLEFADAQEVNRVLTRGCDSYFRVAQVQIAGCMVELKSASRNTLCWLPTELIDAIDLRDKQQNPRVCLGARVKFKTYFSAHVERGTPGTIVREFRGFWIVEDDPTSSFWLTRTCELEALE